MEEENGEGMRRKKRCDDDGFDGERSCRQRNVEGSVSSLGFYS